MLLWDPQGQPASPGPALGCLPGFSPATAALGAGLGQRLRPWQLSMSQEEHARSPPPPPWTLVPCEEPVPLRLGFAPPGPLSAAEKQTYLFLKTMSSWGSPGVSIPRPRLSSFQTRAAGSSFQGERGRASEMEPHVSQAARGALSTRQLTTKGLDF